VYFRAAEETNDNFARREVAAGEPASRYPRNLENFDYALAPATAGVCVCGPSSPSAISVSFGTTQMVNTLATRIEHPPAISARRKLPVNFTTKPVKMGESIPAAEPTALISPPTEPTIFGGITSEMMTQI
jgi:hypothetical protein